MPVQPQGWRTVTTVFRCEGACCDPRHRRSVASIELIGDNSGRMLSKSGDFTPVVGWCPLPKITKAGAAAFGMESASSSLRPASLRVPAAVTWGMTKRITSRILFSLAVS
jgi:hypothetical protein